MAVEEIKAAWDVVKHGATLEKQEIIMGLREQHIVLREENISLKEQIQCLNEKLSIVGSLKYESPYYFLQLENEKEGPFCQVCKDSNDKLIRLQSCVQGIWECKNCKNDFKDDSYSELDLNSDGTTYSSSSWMSR